MSANIKIVLIVLVGLGSTLLSVLSSQYFQRVEQNNQLILKHIEQIESRIEQIKYWGKHFVQNADKESWSQITQSMLAIRMNLQNTPYDAGQWSDAIAQLDRQLYEYHRILAQLYTPTINLRDEKEALQKIGLSFSTEIENNIIKPYQKEEGIRVYQAIPIDPFKSKAKDAAYDLIALYQKQRLILLELILSGDLEQYKEKRKLIAEKLSEYNSQMRYLSVLIGDNPNFQSVLESLQRTLTVLQNREQAILQLFTLIKDYEQRLNESGEQLLVAAKMLSTKVSNHTRENIRLNEILNWMLLTGILLAMVILGIMLARNIIQFVEKLKSAQQEIQTSEEKYRTLLENLPQKIFYKDVQQRYLSCNNHFAEDLGINADEITGKTDYDFFPDALAEKYRADDIRIIHSGLPEDIEENYFKNGVEFVVQTVKTPVKDENNNTVGILGIFWDITDRKRDELELRHLRNLLSNIINSMPSVLIGVDDKGKVTQWNREAEKITGVTEEAARHQKLEAVFPILNTSRQMIEEAISNLQIRSTSKIPFKLGDVTHFYDLTVYPLTPNGIEGAVIRFDDVTERVRLEEMMIQSEKMASVGGLAAGLAHEINNPLAGIVQSLQVLKNRMRGDLIKNRTIAEKVGVEMDFIEAYMRERKMIETIDKVLESGKRAAEIINNMLSFSRKSDSTVSSLSVTDLLDRTVELASHEYDLKKKYDFKQIGIVREFESNMPLIPCDSGKMQQVFLNILRNGAQAMATKLDQLINEGKNKYKPEFVFRAHIQDDMVRIEIQDNGPGMDELTRKRIFEPFYTTKPIGVGTGLGMYVSYFIITENHGGRITVESTQGEGTRFIIWLPLQRSKIQNYNENSYLQPST